MLCIGGEKIPESELEELISPDSDEICDLEYVDWEMFNAIMREEEVNSSDEKGSN